MKSKVLNSSWPVLLTIAYGVILFSCSEKKKTEKINGRKNIAVPVFNADSAYEFVKEQVDFGPRIPNSEAHKKAGDEIISRLESYGAKLTVQKFPATTYDDVHLNLRNIVGSFVPNAKKRILLATHWDTRPWASKDKVDPTAEFDGANDGASGVGVLLEIARELGDSPKPEVGVDLLFFDGEDWGQENGGDPASWCLGSQYWSKHKHVKGYSAYYGILLDMVGAKNAQFPFEGYSHEMARKVLNKVWRQGIDLGYSKYFITKKEGSITDDHYYVNTEANIPMIDILHWDRENGYFGDFHHSLKDNMSIIDPNTLKAVGQTLLHVVYYE